jgi:hypothetical protein
MLLWAIIGLVWVIRQTFKANKKEENKSDDAGAKE